MSQRGKAIRTRNSLEERFEEREPLLRRWPAVMGDGAGNLYPDATNRKYVFVRRIGRGRVEQCRNTRVIAVHNLPVIVGFAPERPDVMQVLDVDDVALGNFLGGYSYVAEHHMQHELHNPSGGGDTVWVWSQQILPFLVQEDDPVSTQVDVRGGNYVYNSTYRTFGGGTTPDLITLYEPAAGLAVMVHIVVDAQSGTLGFTLGAEFASTLPEHMRVEMIPLATGGQIPCGAIYIPNGLTEITWDEIYDTRVWSQPVSAGATHQILSSTHIDTSPEDLVRGDLLVATADDVLARLAAGTAYQFLHVDATGDDPEWRSFDWDFVNQAAGADMVHTHTNNAEGGVLGGAALPHTILDNSAHTDTVAHVVVAGDILYGDATPDWNALAHPGAANRVLQSAAALVGWSAQTLVIEAASIVNQDLTTDASVTFADVFVPDGGTFGIDGNELLTVNAAGTFGFSGILGITVEDEDWIGISATDERIVFDTAGDIAVMGANLGVGTTVPGNAHVYVYDAALTSTASFFGIRAHHVKTAGAGAAGDDYYGIHSVMRLNQSTTIDELYGEWVTGELAQGTAGSLQSLYCLARITGGTISGEMRGMQGSVDIDAGTVTGDVTGIYAWIDIEAAATSLGGNVYGARIQIDDDKGASGTVYMVYLNELTGVDYGVYQNGSALNYFGGNTGIGVVPDSRLHVDQSSGTGAIPVLHLDQADDDVVLAKITAIAAAASADRTLVADSDFGTPGALVGWIQIEIQDDGNRIADGDYYVPFHAVPT